METLRFGINKFVFYLRWERAIFKCDAG